MAANQVVLEFVGDTTGLNTAKAALTQIGDLTEAEVADFKALNAETQKQNKALSEKQKRQKDIAEAAKFERQEMQRLLQAVNSIPTNIVKGVFTEATQEAAAFAQETQVATEKQLSLRAQIRAIREELGQLAVNGQDNTDKFRQLTKEAGRLQDAMNDVNEQVNRLANNDLEVTLNGTIEGLQGVVAGYSVLQGATALFGEENKELQETLVKLNAAMALLQGTQQLQQILRKESALLTLVELGRTKALVAVKNLETAAEGRGVVVKYAAAIATRVLNAALAANPVLLVLGGIVALSAALLVFSSNTETATEKQVKLNEAMERNLKFGEAMADNIAKRNEGQITALGNEIAMLKAVGANTQELLQKESDLAVLRTKSAEEQIKAFQTSTGGYKDEQRLIEDIIRAEQKLEGIRTSLSSDKVDYLGIREKLEAEQQVQEGVLSNLKTRLQLQRSLQQNLTELELEQTRIANEQRKLQFQNDKAYFERLLIEAGNSFKAQFDARLQLLKNEQDAALLSTSLTEQERLLVIAQFQQKERELRAEYRRKAIEEAKAAIDAELVTAAEGSRAELDLRIQSLRKQRDAELSSITLTQNQKRLINDQAEKEILDLVKAYGIAQRQARLNAEASYIQARAAMAKEGSEAALQAQLDLIDNQAQLEAAAAQQSIKNETELQARLVEITETANRQKLDAQREYGLRLKQLKEEELAAEQDYQSTLLSIIENDARLSEGVRFNARQERLTNELELIGELEDANDKALAEKLVSEQEYSDRSIELAKQRALAQAAIDQSAYDEKKRKEDAWREFYFNSVQTLVDTAFTILNDQRQAQFQETLDAISEQKDAAIEALELQKEKELVTEEQYAARKKAIEDRAKQQERQAKTKAAQADKQAAIFQALIAGAVAFVRALPNIPLAVGTAVATAAQVALIASKPIPQFADGTKGDKKTPKGMKWVGEKGPELIYTPGGEKILTNKDSMELMKRYQIPALTSSVTTPQLPVISREVVDQYQQDVTDRPAFEMDYDMMAEKFSEQLRKNPQTVINIDKGGFNTVLREKGRTVRLMNNKQTI